MGRGAFEQVTLCAACALVVASASLGGSGCGGGGGSGSSTGSGSSSTSSGGGSGSSSGGEQPTDWHLEPIAAEFVQAEFATHYTVTMVPDTTQAPKALNIAWDLSLQLVDPAGAADPSQPGSGAAVDSACTNAGLGTTTPVTRQATLASPSSTDSFVWTHPDPANSTPPGKYGCDHSLQGPSGHQGLVTVTVGDGVWTCVESYAGTHTSDVTSGTDPNSTDPVCTKSP